MNGSRILLVSVLACALALVSLDARPAPAVTTFIVTNTNDSGAGSLRQAMLDANATANSGGPDVINFNIAPGGAQTISPASALPQITEAVIIDGTTQPGYGGTPIIELNGNNVSPFGVGLSITGGNSVLRGLVVNRYTLYGIRLQSNSNSISNSYIGTDPTGTVDLGNETGISVQNASSNCIGGAIVSSVCTHAAGDRNVISGNTFTGVSLAGSGTANVVLGNYIGTDAGGTGELGNGGDGVLINGPDSNTIGGIAGTTLGGSCTGDCNLISGNFIGVRLASGSLSNGIRGNFIGTDVTGNIDLGNATHGIIFESGSGSSTVGAALTAARNVISGNNAEGIQMSGNNVTIASNYIGTNSAGTADLGNTRRGVFIAGSGTASIGINGVPASGNLISGNNLGGIAITTSATSGNFVFGNLIGTAADGITPLGNGGAGVAITGTNNLIGVAGQGNAIAFNSGDGVHVNGGTGSAIRGNSIHHNTGKGIETINGGNTEPTPPTVTSAGSAAGTATCVNAPCNVDVYSDTAEEGRVYHGSAPVSSGTWSFGGAVVGPNVTATITDALGNTSEFSSPFPCTDSDSDLMCDSGDPCPAVPDCDGDGWKDGSEANFIGTDPLDACRDDSSDNAWPADINNDGFSDISDIVAVADWFVKAVPPAPARHNVAPEPPDSFVDISDIVRLAGLFGQGCGP